MRLYDLPRIYEALLVPETDLVADVEAWASAGLGCDPAAILDPACGPGGWLKALARPGQRLLGSDLEPGMIAQARRSLVGISADLRVADMRELPFRDASADLALNLHGSVGHLDGKDSVLRHLREVARVLRPGGVYLLGATELADGPVSAEPEMLWSRPATPMPGGGMAALAYESIWRDPGAGRERIRLMLLTKGVRDAPPVLEEQYELLTFRAAGLAAIVEEAGFETCACHHMLVEGRPDLGLADGAGDVTLVLRRPE